MATPSLALVPSGIKATKVYSVLPNNGDGDFTFARASTATRINKDGLIESVATNVPRLNYELTNGVAAECPSLLLEPSRTNLLTYSEDFSQWSTSGVTITPNSVISPDGTLNASLFSHSGGSFPQIALSGLTFVSGADYSASLYVKSDGTTQVQHSLLVNGQVINFTPTDEWVRITDTIVSPDTSGSFVIAQNSGSAVAASFYIWGAQLEAGSYPTSYIPTSGSTQTRSAETCNGAGTASTFNSTEGVLYAEIAALSNDQTNRRITISDGTNTNRIVTGYNTTSNQIFYFVVVGGATVASGNYTSSDITGFSKIAIKYKVNDFALWVDGTERHTDSSGAVFSADTLDSLQFEQGAGGSLYFYGNVKELRVYNEALTDAQLQTLTT